MLWMCWQTVTMPWRFDPCPHRGSYSLRKGLGIFIDLIGFRAWPFMWCTLRSPLKLVETHSMSEIRESKMWNWSRDLFMHCLPVRVFSFLLSHEDVLTGGWEDNKWRFGFSIIFLLLINSCQWVKSCTFRAAQLCESACTNALFGAKSREQRGATPSPSM